MFKQIRRSNPKFKLALNKSSSHKKRFGASSGKENVVPKSSAKSSSVAGERSVKNMTKKIHKRPSGYLADVSSDSLYSEVADSIMDDSLIQDSDEESTFDFEGAYTSSPLRVAKRTTARFAFDSEEKDAGVENYNLSNYFEYHSMGDVPDTTMYDIVANDSVELTKKRLPSIVVQGGEDEESDYAVEGIIANDSIELMRKRVPSSKAQGSDNENTESDFVMEGDSQFNADASSSEAIFKIPTVVVTAPSDLMQEMEQNVDYEYDNKVLEDRYPSWDLPGIIVTSPSDGDVASTIASVVELDYMSIVDQGCKYFLLDGTLHNWDLRYNTGEIFPDHDLRGSGRIEAAGIQLLVSSPSDGDLQFDNIVENDFEVEDIMDHSYKHHLLDASLHNWSMRFNFESYLRELQGFDDAPYDEDEAY